LRIVLQTSTTPGLFLRVRVSILSNDYITDGTSALGKVCKNDGAFGARIPYAFKAFIAPALMGFLSWLPTG
jgi:hypothetical protein